jgi:hypothetical protein
MFDELRDVLGDERVRQATRGIIRSAMTTVFDANRPVTGRQTGQQLAPAGGGVDAASTAVQQDQR